MKINMSSNTSKSRNKCVLPLLFSCICALTATASWAGDTKNAKAETSAHKVAPIPNDTLSLKYDLTRSDLRLMKLSFNVNLRGDTYQASHNLKSKGLVKLFADLKSKASVEGKIQKASLMPLNFEMISGKKSKVKTSKLIWENNKLSRNVTPALSTERAKSLEPVLKSDITDPLSGLLSLVLFDDPEKPCAKTIRLFEGRKIFDLSYSYAGPSKIAKSDAGSFRGPAHKCIIKHTPIAGYSAKKMEKALQANEIHNVWIARIKSPTSHKSYFVPVKMQLTTKFGLIDMNLEKGKINGRKLRKAAIALN